MIIFLFVFTLLGLQIFGGQIPEDQIGEFRQNWDNLENSFMNTF